MSDEKKVLVITADTNFGCLMKDLLSQGQYVATIVESLEGLTLQIQPGLKAAAIVDLNTIGADNYQVKEIRRKYPHLVLLASSDRKFHPELQEALRMHFFACLTTPIDAGDMLYLLKDVFD